MSKFEEAVEDIEKGISFQQFTEEEVNILASDIERLKTRHESMQIKLEGDKRYEQGFYDTSL